MVNAGEMIYAIEGIYSDSYSVIAQTNQETQHTTSPEPTVENISEQTNTSPHNQTLIVTDFPIPTVPKKEVCQKNNFTGEIAVSLSIFLILVASTIKT